MLPSLALAAAFALPLPAPVRFDRHGDPLPPGALARFGTLRFSTSAPTLRPGFSPDGKRAVMRTTPDDRVCVLDIPTGTEVGGLNLPSDVNGYAFLTDSVVAVATDTGVRLWEPGTTKEPTFLDPLLLPEDPICVARSPDGTRWAVGGFAGVHVLTYPACELVAKSDTDLQVTKLVFSPDGKQLIGQVRGNAARHWDAATGKRVRTWAMPDMPAALAFAPDGKSFFAVSDGWVAKQPLADDAPDAAFNPTLDGSESHSDLHLSADGKLRVLCKTEPGQVLELDADSGKRLATLKQPEAAAVDFFSRLHPDGKTVLGTRNGRVWRWDADTGEGPVYEPLGRLVKSVFTPDGNEIRTLSNGGVRFTWNATTGKPTADPTPMLDAVAWDRTLTRVAEVVPEGVSVREVGTGKELARLPTGKAESGAVWFQPAHVGDDLLACLNDSKTDLWDIARGRRAFVLPVACEEGGLVLSARRRTVFRVNRDDHLLEVWETATGLERTSEPMTGDQFTADPDGRHVWALGRDTTVVKIDTSTAKVVRTVTTAELLAALGVSSDGRRLAGFNAVDETLSVLDTATGTRTHTFRTPQHLPDHIDFSADGTKLVTTGVEGVAYVWDLSRPAALAEVAKPVVAFRDANSAVNALRSAEASTAHQGMTWLEAHPAEGVKALAVAFPPAQAVPAARLEQLLADRDSPDFKTRLTADNELAKLGPLAADALKAEAEKPRSEEVRAAVEALLAKLGDDVPTGERLAESRAVEVAERIGTPDAKSLLTAWAGGAPAATLTREATAAVTGTAGVSRPGGK